MCLVCHVVVCCCDPAGARWCAQGSTEEPASPLLWLCVVAVVCPACQEHKVATQGVLAACSSHPAAAVDCNSSGAEQKPLLSQQQLPGLACGSSVIGWAGRQSFCGHGCSVRCCLPVCHVWCWSGFVAGVSFVVGATVKFEKSACWTQCVKSEVPHGQLCCVCTSRLAQRRCAVHGTSIG